MIRSQIPRFRLPEVGDRRGGAATSPTWASSCASASAIDSLKALLAEGYDAIFVGSRRAARPRPRYPRPQGGRGQHPYRHRLAVQRLLRPYRQDRQARHRAGRRQHRDGLLPHLAPPGRRGRQGDRAQRLRGDEGVALGEGGRHARGHPDPQLSWCPRNSPTRTASSPASLFEKVAAKYDDKGRRSWCRPASPISISNATTCWSRSARRTPSPGSSATSASSSTAGACPRSIRTTMQSTIPNVFFGGDAAFGPKNIIWAVAHGHDAAISIDKLCNGEDVTKRPPPDVALISQKMGIHEWSYDNDISNDLRYRVPLRDKAVALKDVKVEVELGFDRKLGYLEAERCLNCDVADRVHRRPLHRVRRLRRHLPDGLHHLHRERRGGRAAHAAQRAGEEPRRRTSTSPTALKTGRIMAKDEDVCLHCGLCAERCPTGAWDMQKFLLDMTHGRTRMSQADSQHQRFRRQVRQRQRLGLGERQPAVRQVDPAHGRAGRDAQHLPLEHPGPADLVRGARSPRRAISAGAAASI